VWCAAVGGCGLRIPQVCSRLRIGIALKVVGVQGAVLQIRIEQSMPVGATATSHCVGKVSCGASILGGEVVGRDAVFLYSFRSDGGEWTGDQVVVVLEAVEQKVRCGGPLAVHGQPKPARGSDV